MNLEEQVSIVGGLWRQIQGSYPEYASPMLREWVDEFVSLLGAIGCTRKQIEDCVMWPFLTHQIEKESGIPEFNPDMFPAIQKLMERELASKGRPKMPLSPMAAVQTVPFALPEDPCMKHGSPWYGLLMVERVPGIPCPECLLAQHPYTPGQEGLVAQGEQSGTLWLLTARRWKEDPHTYGESYIWRRLKQPS